MSGFMQAGAECSPGIKTDQDIVWTGVSFEPAGTDDETTADP